jgi:hypothetical protein
MDAFVAAVNVHVAGYPNTVWWRRVCILYNNIL